MIALFVADRYYPSGGWDDLRAVVESVAEARALAPAPAYGDEIQQIVDLDAGAIVCERELIDGAAEWTHPWDDEWDGSYAAPGPRLLAEQERGR